MKQVEIRSYNLKPSMRDAFHQVMSEQAVPMLRDWGVDVVCFHASSHDADSYYLIRAYDSLLHRQSSQDEFYGSDAWRQGPRELIVSKIENYASIVIEMNDAQIDALRK